MGAHALLGFDARSRTCDGLIDQQPVSRQPWCMPMPAHLEAWWREHPERWSQRQRHGHGFPAEGSLGQQIDWFRRQFLKLADKASSTKERGEFLRLAFMATLKGENAGVSDGALAQYRIWLHTSDTSTVGGSAANGNTVTSNCAGIQINEDGRLQIAGDTVSYNTLTLHTGRR
jgi:hypothetical protein